MDNTPIPPHPEVEEWNTKYAIGQRVRYWPGVRKGEGILSKTRTPAFPDTMGPLCEAPCSRCAP